MIDDIETTATRILDQAPGIVVRYRLLRDVLKQAPDCPELRWKRMMCLALNLLSKRGRGDIYFITLRGKGRHRHMKFDHGFLDIAEVEQVADLMRRTFPDV